MTETENFRTERLMVRPWQIEDLPLAAAAAPAYRTVEKFLAEFGRRLQYRTEVVLPLAVE